MDLTAHRRIVIEGPIGVGKTAMAQRLASTFGATAWVEDTPSNPFLPRFYDDPRGMALATELHFLIERAPLFRQMAEHDGPWFADGLPEKQRLFARLNLDADEWRLYEHILREMHLDNLPPPDLVIGLQAPAPVLRERLQRRGVLYEQGISSHYLERVVDAYSRLFLDYDRAPVLIINAASIDPLHCAEDYQQLVDLIRQPLIGRQYYNPMAACREAGA